MSSAYLNFRTEYSHDGGVAPTEALLDRARELKLAAVGRVDRASLLGLDRFLLGARRRGLSAVAGVELDLAALGQAEPASLDDLTAPVTFPIVLFAESAAGYRNLVRLVSGAHARAGAGDGERPATGAPWHSPGRRGAGRPFITLDDLEAHHQGLIAQSPGLAGELSCRILRGQVDLSERLALRLAGVFGPSSFYLGLSLHGHPLESRLAAEIAELARRTGLPVIASDLVDHLDPDDALARDVRRAIADDAAYRPGGDPLRSPASHFRTPAERRRLYRDHPEALDNALALAERAALSPEELTARVPAHDAREGDHLRFPMPAGRTEAAYLASLCAARLPRRPDYELRLDQELAAIRDGHLAGWFLIQWDLHRYLRAHGAALGPGRGGITSSLTAWLLGITAIDPVAVGLSFERFLADLDTGLPAATLEIEPDRVAEARAYIEHRHGPDRVAHAASLTRYTPRTAARDVGRTLSIGAEEVTAATRHLPDGPSADLALAVARDERLARRYRQDADVRTWLNLSRRLQGLPMAVQADPARLILSARPFAGTVPVMRDEDGRRYAEIEGVPVDRSMMVVEIVAVKGLPRGGLYREAVDLEARVVEASLATVARREKAVADRFRRRAAGEEEVRFAEPRLEPILFRTHGLLLEQEQLVDIARVLAGFSERQAEEFRRRAVVPASAARDEVAATSRILELRRWRFEFVDGALARGVPVAVAESIFQGLMNAAPRLASRADSVAQVLRSTVVGAIPFRTGRPAAAALAASAGPSRRSNGRVSDRPAQLAMPWVRPFEPEARPEERRTGTYGSL